MCSDHQEAQRETTNLKCCEIPIKLINWSKGMKKRPRLTFSRGTRVRSYLGQPELPSLVNGTAQRQPRFIARYRKWPCVRRCNTSPLTVSRKDASLPPTTRNVGIKSNPLGERGSLETKWAAGRMPDEFRGENVARNLLFRDDHASSLRRNKCPSRTGSLISIDEGIVYDDLGSLAFKREGHLLHAFRHETIAHHTLTAWFTIQKKKSPTTRPSYLSACGTMSSSQLVEVVDL